MDTIERLAEETKRLMASEENARRTEVQERLNGLEAVHPVPFNSWNLTAGFPIVIIAWCRRLDHELDIEKTARETGRMSRDMAAELIEFQLRQKIEKFRSVPEDVPMSDAIHTNMGLCWMYQKSPLGEKYTIDNNTGAFIPQPVVKDESDLERMQLPRYELEASLHADRVALFQGIVGEGFTIVDDALPRGIGAPFSTANNLAGVLELLEAFVTRPAFVHRLMGFIADAIVSYTGQMAEALGGPRLGTFGCDEVSCDMFSPQAYEEFVWPYECRAASAYASIYYHSCGNLTPIFHKILEIPNIHRVHVSPWSDMEAAVRVLGGKVILEKHLDPTIKLGSLSEEEMRAYVREVTDLGTDYPLDMVVSTNTEGGREYRRVFYEEAGAVPAASV